MKTAFKPSTIYIEKGSEDYPLTNEILRRFPDVKTESANHPEEVYSRVKQNKDPWVEGKRSLYLSKDKGRSFKPFPEVENYFVCDYYSLHIAEGCNLECSYCILQSYLTNPLLMIYVNLDEIFESVAEFLKKHSDRTIRIGTGHLSDSLSLDHITHFSEKLIEFIKTQPNAILELKSKSDQVENLLDLDPNHQVVVSWSMNAKKIQQEEEHKCASLNERIVAAKRVIDAGSYKVGFHFDPIVEFEGWEKQYEETITAIAKDIPVDRIAWISIGSLRMMPDLKKKMNERFPKSKLPTAEWIKAMDGKLRYIKPKRIEMYQAFNNLLDKHLPGATKYLIMETPEVWRRVFGKEFTKEMICEMLDASVTSCKP